MASIGDAELGVSTFCAASHQSEKCGANGLPLTPNSIRILGRFPVLKTLSHPRLCKYVDLVREKHERLIVVTEFYKTNLAAALRTSKYSDTSCLTTLAFEILSGLAYLNSRGFIHRNLSPQNILFDTKGFVKLANYGMYYMTDSGADVSFPIGLLKYMSPEVLAQGRVRVTSIDREYATGWKETRQLSHAPSSCKTDVWSLGIMLLEAFLGSPLWPNLTLQQIIHKILAFAKSKVDPIVLILSDHHGEEKFALLPNEIQSLISTCLTLSPKQRPMPIDLLSSSVFNALKSKEIPYSNGFSMFSTNLRCQDLEIPEYVEGTEEDHAKEEDLLSERSIHEVYYLWRLAGGDLVGALTKAGLVRTRPPITKIANFTLDDGEFFGEGRDRSTLLDCTVVILSQDQLRQRLKHVEPAAFYPLLEEEKNTALHLPISPSSGDLTDTSKLPLVIKERDVEYQFHRAILYERLLKAYPYKRHHIWKEARTDIPPFVRAEIWAALLEVEGDIQGTYDAIDKETPTATDRQIEVDIPRCHQYCELLSSPEGHEKFKRVLKAWVVSHPEYVYWQGLDSLCAPFLYLNFNNEALAYACFKAFIPKYLHKLFLKDNSKVIQEYLAVFSHLIAFHDAPLSNHLNTIGFIPDLYAIPWFLTMFAHAFPLHKLFHLWDTLLLGNSSFPLCIGVAILYQLRDQLLSFGFNECILLFSDMPEIDIERCVQDSIRIFCLTPKSATYRQHAKPSKREQKDSSSKPDVSYYSKDYNHQPLTDLSMHPVPLEDLRAQKCPFISAEDLIQLGELMGSSLTKSPTKKSASGKPLIIILDIRPTEDYLRGCVPGSINIPFDTAFNSDGDFLPSPAVTKLNVHKTQVKVVVGSRDRSAIKFAESLLRLGYNRACVLYKGVDVLRPTGILTVPTPDL
ncbi:hypothetical protein CAPTEDRAFT_220004 [Capitella teleta]|uniref:TBC domain-containing protein kinase-like protein n=1 Tax=Capitella teleta TaxID=283909 RepID=R7UJG7_CAPTE|nr:hypothetical protein CAPTEDRAFT_220004 [Capitella teleta]|eukprot:ELU03407.1 hypothetical protein CAPTEDRAFT_220004 [Capitella teleta]